MEKPAKQLYELLNPKMENKALFELLFRIDTYHQRVREKMFARDFPNALADLVELGGHIRRLSALTTAVINARRSEVDQELTPL